MPRLPVLKPKVVVKILEKAGFCFIRQNGSHQIYVKDNSGNHKKIETLDKIF